MASIPLQVQLVYEDKVNCDYIRNRMAAAIKRFFEKRKTAAKFKLAGTGHRLNDPSEKRPVPQSARAQPRPPSRQGPTEEQLQAAQAAMSRLSMPSKPGQKCRLLHHSAV